MSASYKTNRHSCYELRYHLVVTIKGRYECINQEIKNSLIEICNNIFNKWKCSPLEINVELQYIHIFFEAPPQVQPSKLINNFKTVSSRLIRRDFKDYLAKFNLDNSFWDESYLILSAGGDPSGIIDKFIQKWNNS